MSSRQDERFMRRALHLARRGQGRVEPNPMVGCVIVRDGGVIGEGYHRRFGGRHAEIEALRGCRRSPRGATAYVTLEPCCHFGKTPPCTQALLEAGVGRVVAAMEDPGPQVSGRGLRLLRAAGVDCSCGLLAAEAAELNAPYLKLVRSGRPWVILKWAQSIDGRIATRSGDSKWISDAICRHHAHTVRARVDAIVAGVETVLRDDPLLTAREVRVRRIARRIVLDSHLRTPLTSRLVRTALQVPTWIACTSAAPRRREQRLAQAGCRILRVRSAKGRVSLAALLERLGREQLTNVLVEGGGRVLGSFCDQRLADEVHVYVAPLLIGGEAAVPALSGRGAGRVAQALRLETDGRLRRLGNGWFLQARVGRQENNGG